MESSSFHKTALEHHVKIKVMLKPWHSLHFRYCYCIHLKVRECEIFDLFILFIICREVSIGRGLGGWNKKLILLKFGPGTYHFIFASVCAVYAGNNFWHRVSTKKSCFRFLWGPLECVKIAFFDFSLFSLVKTWFGWIGKISMWLALLAYTAHTVTNC